jgi:hypothetical protein
MNAVSIQPTWPAVISDSMDPELIYVSDASALAGHNHPLINTPGGSGRLIDAGGKVFDLDASGAEILLTPSAQRLELDQVLHLVRAHAARSGACCVAKLWAPTIVDAFQIVESLDGENH